MKKNPEISSALQQRLKEIMDSVALAIESPKSHHSMDVWLMIKAVMLQTGLTGEPDDYLIGAGILTKDGKVVARDIRYEEKEEMLYFTFRPEQTVNYINISGVVIS